MERERPLSEQVTYTAVRVAAGLGFFTHGGQKIFGWFGGFGEAGTADLASRFGVAGVVEVVAGLAIAIGLFTRPVAFVASGQMAVAYFWSHVSRRDALFWWDNGGELAMVYSFFFLFVVAYGAGPFSVDARLAAGPHRTD
jgi:putative oxidoreductase